MSLTSMPTDNRRDHLIRRLNRYRGFVFRWQPYRALSSDWNHDHCNGCWARFAEQPSEWAGTVHTEGGVTLWPAVNPARTEAELVSKCRAAEMTLIPSPKLHGFQLDWLCPECFETCRQELGFVVDPEHPQWQQAGL